MIEKPIVTHLDECIKIKQLMNNNIKLMTGYTIIYLILK